MTKNQEQTSFENRIKERLGVLTKERDTFVAEANRQIAAYSASIGELQALLEPEPEMKDDDEPA